MFRNVKYVPPNTPCPYQLVSSSVQIPFWGQHSWHTNVYVYPYIRPHKKRRGPTRKRKETYNLYHYLRCTVLSHVSTLMKHDVPWSVTGDVLFRIWTPVHTMPQTQMITIHRQRMGLLHAPLTSTNNIGLSTKAHFTRNRKTPDCRSRTFNSRWVTLFFCSS